jgi:aspartyl-tRNA(Asn)/glutamyl-tRNA(Gln) amidotransferase subunit A
VYLPIVLADAAAYHAHTLETMPERYTPGVRLRLEAGRYVRAEDYLRALDGCRVLRNEVDAAMAGSDGLVLPTLPIVAPLIGAITVDLGGTPHPVRNVMLRLTQLFNITGHPAVTLPCGTSASGLPCGLQLAGAFGQTDTLLHVAKGVEEVLRCRPLQTPLSPIGWRGSDLGGGGMSGGPAGGGMSGGGPPA